ncbi:MAG: hypothetical protein INH37_27695, partial [Myxococcaceae bacterium]|nr:hypothetical protein [Myxococcaceae bacterium]
MKQEPPETAAALAELTTRVARLEAQERERSSRARRRARVLVGGAVLALVVAPLALAADGLCPNGLPFCFSADTPAKASEVNTNFAQLKEWLESKVGPVDGGTVTGSSASFAGAASVGSLAVQGTSQLNGEVTLSQTARVRIQSSSWCDCEYASQLTTRQGTVLSASVADLFLFENN